MLNTPVGAVFVSAVWLNNSGVLSMQVEIFAAPLKCYNAARQCCANPASVPVFARWVSKCKATPLGCFMTASLARHNLPRK